MIRIFMMYPNIRPINAASLFFQVYKIVSVENKLFFCL